MKSIAQVYLLFFCFSFFSCKEEAVEHKLIPVKKKNKYGYIDSTGRMIIPAKFYAAQPFSEGLAAVRENSYYGYINSNGGYEIAPQYDYAESFSCGIARVYKNGKSVFVDKTNKIRFNVPDAITHMEQFAYSFAVVRGANKFAGVMNVNGEIVIDTVFTFLKSIGEGKYIAENFLADSLKIEPVYSTGAFKYQVNFISPHDYGLLNVYGDTLIPFGKYVEIKKIGNSTLIAKCRKSTVTHHCFDIYNSNQELIYSYEGDLPYISEYSFETGDYIVSFSNAEGSEKVNRPHAVLLNKKGEIILDKPEFTEIRCVPFSGKAFVRKKDDGFFRLINLKGEPLDEIRYRSILDDDIFDNPLLVFYDIDVMKTKYIKDCWCILNPDLTVTTIDEFCGRGWGFQIEYRDNMYVLSEDGEPGIVNYGCSKNLNGIGKVPLLLKKEPVIWDIGTILASSSTDTSQTVCTSDGRMIYNSNDTYKKYKYNIDNKILMRLRVHGWGELFDYMDMLPQSQKDVFNTVDFVTVTSEVKNKVDYYDGYAKDKFLERKIIVSNKSKTDTISLTTVRKNSELVLIIEAFNNENEMWIPVTFVDGQKDTVVKKLLPGYCWQLFIPEFEGGMRTFLRAKVEVVNNKTGKPEYIYSKPYPGSVNPGQFWRYDPSDEFWSCPENKFRVFEKW